MPDMAPFTPQSVVRAVEAHHWPAPMQWIADMLLSVAAAWEAEQRQMQALAHALRLKDARIEALEKASSERNLALVIEGWLHRIFDADYRPTPNATMRWQWCQRPHHSEDDDCAACLMSAEGALEEATMGCECPCHERVRSLACYLAVALAPNDTRQARED